LNKKKLALIMIVASMLLMVPLVTSQSTLLSWTDKPKYSPGDTVTINLSYYNDLTSAVQVNNITLTFANWNAYIGGNWVGNMTKTYTDVTVTSKTVHVFSDLTFSVPTDGRAEGTDVYIRLGTDHGFLNAPSVYVSLYDSVRYFDQIVMLLTIMAVLTIVCTIIIAATIFLSARRPQVMWKTEEKT
jgi:hypothetical protein